MFMLSYHYPRTDKTQYAYSAWAPQFADKLQLSATQSNVIVRRLFLLYQTPQLTDTRARQRTWACMPRAYQSVS